MELSKDKGEEDKMNEMPSSSRDLSKSLPEEAFNNFLQGKRHMLVQDYTFAVQSLVIACELYVKHFGELAIECGEVYFLYGKALFRLSQQQSGVLGGALNEGSNDEDEEEKSSEEEESKENDSEKNNSETEGGEESKTDENSKDEKEPSESTDSPQAVLDDENKDNKEKTSEEKVTEGEPSAPDDSAVEENQQECEMEDDLELAWNTLETAKSIFKRQNDVESQLKVAEILQLLAEISMESDNNTAAITDLKECLAIQEKHLNPDDRILAETYYQMGLAQMLDKQYSEALSNFQTTMKILNLRKENLKNQCISETVGSFESADKEMEIADLEQILQDIKEKIEDTEELIRNMRKELEEAVLKDTVVVNLSTNSAASSSKPVTNITHLLKRKKPDDGDDTDSKRIKLTSNVPNGDSNVVSGTVTSSKQSG